MIAHFLYLTGDFSIFKKVDFPRVNNRLIQIINLILDESLVIL